MGTKNNPGSFDCYAAAMPDEPIFHLLGRDPAFPATLRFWVEERVRQAKTSGKDDRGKLAEAVFLATQAEKWRGDLVELTAEGDPYPWQNRMVDTYDREPPVRVEPWSGNMGGPVVSTPLFAEWYESGDFAVGIAYAKSYDKLPGVLMDLSRDGWSFTGVLGGCWLFKRVNYAGTAQTAPAPSWDTGALETIQDNLHLRAKAVVGLNQIGNDIAKVATPRVIIHGEPPRAPATEKELLTFVDRINGYAAELGAGVPVDMIHFPGDDPARGADTSHATVAVAPENLLDFGGPESVLDLAGFEAPAERPCDPATEDCTGLGRGLQP